VLKEYIFDPASQQISVLEGKTTQITIYATRTAYSCFGAVFALNGDPEKSIGIEAVGKNNEYEESTSDQNGQFRLRGLLPNTEYTISIKKSNERLERSSPENIRVKIIESDLQGVDFVVFRKSNKFDLTGVVNTTRDVLFALKVELFQESQSSEIPIKVIPLGPLNFFSFSNLDVKEKYSVRVQTTLSPKSYNYEIKKIPVDITYPNTYLGINFDVTVRTLSQDITNAPVFLLVAIVASILGYFYNKQIQVFIATYIGQKVKKEEIKQSSSEDEDQWLSDKAKQSKYAKRPKGSFKKQ